MHIHTTGNSETLIGLIACFWIVEGNLCDMGRVGLRSNSATKPEQLIKTPNCVISDGLVLLGGAVEPCIG